MLKCIALSMVNTVWLILVIVNQKGRIVITLYLKL